MVGLIGLGAALCACVLTVIVAFPVRALDFWAATYDYGLVQRVAWLLFQIAVIPLAFGCVAAVSAWWLWGRREDGLRWYSCVPLAVLGGLVGGTVGCTSSWVGKLLVAGLTPPYQSPPSWLLYAVEFLSFAGGVQGVFIGCGVWLGRTTGRRLIEFCLLGFVLGGVWGLAMPLLNVPHICYEISLVGVLATAALFVAYHSSAHQLWQLGNRSLVNCLPRFSLRSLLLLVLSATSVTGLWFHWETSFWVLALPAFWLTAVFGGAFLWSVWRDRQYFRSLAATREAAEASTLEGKPD